MANIGMGGQLPHNLTQANNKTKKADELSKKDDDLKGREVLAGSKQVEGKYKKESAVKNTERFRAFKSAYNYMLGEEPEEEEIDEEMQSAPLEEEKEEVKNKKARPNLKEIEEYNTRDKFKAKLGLTLGDDFNEDAPPEDEDMTPEQKADDNKIKLEAAKEAYNNLIEYMVDSLGTYNIDKIEDLQLFLSYGMPEDAIIKFVMLQQLSRASADFPNIMDMSIMLNKFKKLKIDMSVEQAQEIALNDYGTSKRLKYTVSGFIYIPIPQVMAKIEDDMKIAYEHEFHELLLDLELPDLKDIKQKMPENIMIPMRDRIFNTNKDINNLISEKNNLTLNLKLPMVKDKEGIQEKITQINIDITDLKQELKEVELIATQIIFIYSFLNSNTTISEFNKQYPLDILNGTLSLMGIKTNKDPIKQFLSQKVNIYSLDPIKKKSKEVIKKSNEIFENRVKSAVFEFGKIPAPKQQQLMKNFRNNPFDANTNFYWLKQKKLADINNLSEVINKESEEN